MSFKNSMMVWLALLSAPLCAGAPLQLSVDATQIVQRIVHAELQVEPQAGQQTWLLAKWLPGEHSPTAAIDGMTNLKIEADGKRLSWRRDPLDLYRFQFTVPARTKSLRLNYDFALRSSGASSNDLNASAKQAKLSFNSLILFPADIDTYTIPVQTQVRVPDGWQAVGALGEGRGTVTLEPTTVGILIDSPMLIGEYVKTLAIPVPPVRGVPGWKQRLVIAADSNADLQTPDGFVEQYAQLVGETEMLFVSRHFRHYDWLVSLTDQFPYGGLEHHESSDDRDSARALLEPESRRGLAELLSHEFVHSWNGKYRRPRGLLSPSFQEPMDGTLLWMYEGQTQFWGYVLAVRAGLIPEPWFREVLASIAAFFEYQTGKQWRSLADTAISAQRLYEAPTSWANSRRGVDFYDESILMWLDVENEMRSASAGKKGIDDFAQVFFGDESGNPLVHPYDESDIYQTLNAIVPRDWSAQLHARLDATDGRFFESTLTHAGWKLVYSDTPNDYLVWYDKEAKHTDRTFDFGVLLDEDGNVIDVREGSPCAVAGIAPGMRFVAVNGRKYTDDVLADDIKLAATGTASIRILVENQAYFSEHAVQWNGGLRYPHLVRIDKTPDRLSALLKPRWKRR